MTTERQPLTRERVIEYLRVAILDGKCGLVDVPELIKRVVREDLWRERILAATGEKIVFREFAEFMRTAPPEGLGTDNQTLRRLCADDPEAIGLLDRVKASRTRGGDRKSRNFKNNNVNFEKVKKGNSIEYALKRLRQQRPDLYQCVINSNLTVNQAMIEAGYRKRPLQITLDLNKTAAALKSVLSPGQIEQLISLLQRQSE